MLPYMIISKNFDFILTLPDSCTLICSIMHACMHACIPLTVLITKIRRPVPQIGFFWCVCVAISIFAMVRRHELADGDPSPTGSRAPSDHSSCASSTKTIVGSYDVSGLPGVWDGDATIRERLRNGHNLVVTLDPIDGKICSSHVDATTQNLKLNAPAVLPLAKLVGQHDLRVPSLDRLMGSIDTFYQITKKSMNQEECYQQSWCLRRLLGKLKTFTYRTHPPQDSGSQNFVVPTIVVFSMFLPLASGIFAFLCLTSIYI